MRVTEVLNKYITMEKADEAGTLDDANKEVLKLAQKAADRIDVRTYMLDDGTQRLDVRIKEAQASIITAPGQAASLYNTFLQEDVALGFAQVVQFAVYRHKKTIDSMNQSVYSQPINTASADGESKNV